MSLRHKELNLEWTTSEIEIIENSLSFAYVRWETNAVHRSMGRIKHCAIRLPAIFSYFIKLNCLFDFTHFHWNDTMISMYLHALPLKLSLCERCTLFIISWLWIGSTSWKCEPWNKSGSHTKTRTTVDVVRKYTNRVIKMFHTLFFSSYRSRRSCDRRTKWETAYREEKDVKRLGGRGRWRCRFRSSKCRIWFHVNFTQHFNPSTFFIASGKTPKNIDKSNTYLKLLLLINVWMVSCMNRNHNTF